MAGIDYRPGGEQLRQFMADDSFFRGIRGPIGSGKSAGCCMEIMRRALAQAKGPDGIRRSRWGAVRNTYGELRTTTIKTWLDWFPEASWGKFQWHPPPFLHHIRRGDLDLEVYFLALDKPEDVSKLLSFEFSGIWLNEARELPKPIVDAATSRVGRYPSMRDGGPSWHGVIADTNSPDDQHWWGIMAGEAPAPEWMTAREREMLVKPPNWKFFKQPPAMLETRDASGEVKGYDLNPSAENLKNLISGYYPNLVTGKSKAWVDVYVLNKLGSVSDGKPVYPTFVDHVHTARDPLPAFPGVPLTVGVDFGLTPSAVICQQVRGQWRVLEELVATDMGLVRFAPLLAKLLKSTYQQWKCTIWGDPAGDQRSQVDERTPFDILKANGLNAAPAPSNDLEVRLGTVTEALGRMIDGQPGFLVSPSCTVVRAGFTGGYQYRRLQVSGERYEETPCKNRFSHPHDALQYALVGAGEGRLLLGRRPQRPVCAKAHVDPFARQGPRLQRSTRF